MSTKCKNCPLRRRDLFQKMSSDDIAFMERFKVGELVIDPGAPILMEGANSPQLYTALHGMGLRFKSLPSGERQVLNFVFPGDFIGLQAGILGEMGHSVEATSNMTLCVFNRSEFWNFFKHNPERAFDLTWLAAIEEHFLGDALTAVGQRAALEATAWALVRVYRRADALGLVQNRTVRFPYKQTDLADALGISQVHKNKTLRRLRERQLAVWRNDELQISDVNKLGKIAQIDTQIPAPRPLF